MTGLWQALTDLVVPAACAGCGEPNAELTFDVCAACVRIVRRLEPVPARPEPAPRGLPQVVTLGDYDGVLRGLILEYKDHGRYRLARPLGALLAEAVRGAAPAGMPILLLYVPDTAVAARSRHGDHMRRLAMLAAANLREHGYPAVASRALTAKPALDSAGLNHEERAKHAQGRFVARRVGMSKIRRLSAQAAVVLADDILTTGSTLAAAAQVLARAGISVSGCATLAATRRRLPGLMA